MSTYIEEASRQMQGLVEDFKSTIGERDAAHHKQIDALRGRISDLEAANGRRGLGGGWQDESREQLNKGLRLFLRTGDLSELHTKGMSVGSDPQGGYAVPAELANSITQRIFDTSPIRQISRVVEVGTDALEELLDLDEPAASWVEETGSRAETTTPEIGKLRIPVHEIYAAPRVTQKLLDDAKIDVAEWLSQKIASKFSRARRPLLLLGMASDGRGAF